MEIDSNKMSNPPVIPMGIIRKNQLLIIFQHFQKFIVFNYSEKAHRASRKFMVSTKLSGIWGWWECNSTLKNPQMDPGILCGLHSFKQIDVLIVEIFFFNTCRLTLFKIPQQDHKFDFSDLKNIHFINISLLLNNPSQHLLNILSMICFLRIPKNKAIFKQFPLYLEQYRNIVQP